MLKLTFRLITLPFFIILIVPVLLYKIFRATMDQKDLEDAIEHAPVFFRNLTDILGAPEIPGIEKLSDWEIKLSYRQVREGLEEIAERRNEKIPKSIVNGIVRDTLLDNIYDKEHSYEKMKLKLSEYEAHGIQSAMISGRLYV